MFIAVFLPLFSGEKATIYYKNGSTIDCIIDNYEIGKYAEVTDDKGNKRIISWDNISEVVFINEEEKSVVKDEVETQEVTDAPLPPLVPAAAVPVPTFESQPQSSTGSKSMLEQFNEKDIKTEESKPKNAAERWAERNNQQTPTNQITPENVPDVDVDRKTGKVSVEYYKTLESDANRRSWIENGGILKAKSLTVNYTHASMEDPDYDIDFKTNGFGFAYAWAFKFISPPSYSEGKNNWNAFSLALMGSFNMTNGEVDQSYDDGMGSTFDINISMETLTYEISSNLGYTFGLGKFWSDADWKGIMLGVYWKPNFTISRNFVTTTSNSSLIGDSYKEYDPTSTFNAMGIQWTIDWGSFGALSEKLADEAHFTINGFILPETDDTPFLISIGIGAVWY